MRDKARFPHRRARQYLSRWQASPPQAAAQAQRPRRGRRRHRLPRMPRFADLSPGWCHWSAAEKVEHLLGMTLNQAHDILSSPAAEFDPRKVTGEDNCIRNE